MLLVSDFNSVSNDDRESPPSVNDIRSVVADRLIES